MSAETPGAVPRLALDTNSAADACCVSRSSFLRHIAPELRCIRRGSIRLFPVREIERWLEANAEHTLP